MFRHAGREDFSGDGPILRRSRFERGLDDFNANVVGRIANKLRVSFHIFGNRWSQILISIIIDFFLFCIQFIKVKNLDSHFNQSRFSGHHRGSLLSGP